MTPRQSIRLVVSVLMVVAFAFPAFAAKQDAATLKKIDVALSEHYLAAEYDKAEALIMAAIKACGTSLCSGDVLAKAYVAVGVIRGNTKGDIAGARSAFENAKAADPNATLDAAFATPKVVAEFYKVFERELPKELAQPKPVETSTEPVMTETKEKAPPRVSPAGDMRCTPISAYEIQTAQPIAVVCEPPEGAVRAELYYRTAGESDYTAVLMSVQDGTLRATIPCEAVEKPGKLEVYIIAQDFNKEMIDTFGNIVTPAHYMIVKRTKQPVPTYPGQKAPERCAELLSGAGAVGDACSDDRPCRTGAYCAETNVCTKAPACDTNDDCDSKSCVNGYCAMVMGTVEKEPPKMMFGIHFGGDIWLAPSAKQVCGDSSILAGTYNCYNAGESRIWTSTAEKTNNVPMVQPGNGGNVDAGVRFGTLRALVSADYVLGKYFTAGGRVGWAFRGGPRTIHYDNGKASQSKKFFPVHIEARGTLYLRSLGKTGLHPYVGLGVGAAEVDAKVPIKTKLPLEAGGGSRNLDAWRKLGLGFGAVSLGVLHTFGQHHGLQLNINTMYFFPSAGIVFEPTLGYVLSL